MEAKKIDVPVKRKPGSKSASVELHCTATKPEISQIIQNSYKWFNRTRVETDEECAERLNEFFTECNRTGELPTVEKMALSLGITRKILWDWESGRTKGISPVRRNMIQKARSIMAAIDAELVSNGKIPQVVYIFRAKNYYDMSDQQTINIVPNNPMGDEQTPEEIQKRIEDSIVVNGYEVNGE